MACTYNFKGIEYNTKKQLADAVALEFTNTTTSPNKMMFEVNGKVGENEARLSARNRFGTDEFLTFVEKEDKTYMLVDERLFNEQTGSQRLIYNDQGQLVEVDIDEMINKMNRGQLKNINGSLYDTIQARIADKMIKSAKEELKNEQEGTTQDLMDSLADFAANMGITVTTLEEYKASYEERNGIPITTQALADIFNKTIALGENATLEDFTEEIAHFAVKYYKNQDELTRLLEKVNQTGTYQRYAEQYRTAYSKDYSGEALENKVREEVLGKLWAENILNNYNTQNKGLNETGIINKLQELFNRFLDLFRITDSNQAFFREFGKTLDNLAQQTTSKRYESFSPVDSKEVYYSLSAEQKSVEKSLTNIHGDLVNKYKAIHKDNKSLLRDRNTRLAEIADNIKNAFYLKAIQRVIAMETDDMRKAFNALSNARIAVEEILDKKKQLEGSTYVAPTQEEKSNMIAKELGDVNIANLTVFNRNVDEVIGKLRADIDFIAKNDKNIKREDIASVNRSLESLARLKGEVGPDLLSMQRNLVYNLILKNYLNEGISMELAKTYASDAVTNNMKDIGVLVSFFFSAGTYGNPIVTAVNAYVNKANSNRDNRTRAFLQLFAAKQAELKVGKDDMAKLWSDGYMLDEVDHNKLDRDYEKLKKDIATKKEEAITLAKGNEALIIEADIKASEALEKLQKEWELPKFTQEFENRTRNRVGGINPVTKSKYRSKAAQDIIRTFSSDSRAIMNKYKNPLEITSADKNRLQDIASDRARAASLYDENQNPKTGTALGIALDLQDYYENNKAEISEQAKKRFEMERLKIKSTKPSEYKKWLEFFAYQKYSEKDLPNGELDRVVDNEATETVFKDKQVVWEEIKDSIVIPNLTGEPSFQQAYDALKSKREQLIKPFRKVRNSSEIDGIAIENEPELLSVLEEIDSNLRLFKLDEGTARTFKKTPNEAFKTQYKRILTRSSREQRDWLLRNAEPDTIRGGFKMENGFPIPTQRHYSKYELINDDGSLVEKELSPTLYWEMLVSDKNTLNPEYDTFFEGKTRQYNKPIKEKYKNQKYFDIFRPDSNGVPTQNVNLHKMRQFLLDQKYAMDRNVGRVTNAYYLLPQVRPYTMEALTSVAKLKSAASNVVGVVDNYDEDFNINTIGLGRKGEGTFIPLHFHVRAEDPSILSTDFSHMYTNYAAMTYNHVEKSKILINMEILKDTLGESYFEGKGQGKGTRVYKAATEYLSAHMYGNRFVELKEFTVKGKKISTTKLVNNVTAWQVVKNLGLSIYTPVVGGVAAKIQSNILANEGAYYTDQGKVRANKMMKYGASIIGTARDVGEVMAKTYLGKLDYFSGTGNLENDLSKGMFASNQIERTFKQADFFFAHYQAISKLIRVETTIAVYDNFRLVDGEFITFRAFEDRLVKSNIGISRKEALEQWKNYQSQSVLDFLKENETGIEFDREKLYNAKFTGNVTELKARLDIATKTANDIVEGQVSGTDTTVASRNPLVKFLFTMHRGYFQRFMERAFKPRQLNPIVGAEEEGTYRTFANVWGKSWDGLNAKEKLILFLGYFKAFEQHDKVMTKLGLDTVDVINTRRIRRDMRMYAFAFTLYLLANLLADDEDREDDFFTQYAAYVASRVFNETGSVQLPFGAMDALKLVESPSSGFGFLEDLLGLPGFIVKEKKEITKGAYTGVDPWTRGFIRLTPAKNIIEPMLSNPRKSNLFFRLNTIGPVNESLFENTSDFVYDRN